MVIVSQPSYTAAESERKMERHLCISVTFLDPLYHGRGDRGRPEPLPSPMRLFQAILAGSRAGTRNARWTDDGELATAFRWLERQPPPTIIMPRMRLASASHTIFVPRNDGDETLDRQDRLVSKQPHPHRFASQEGDLGDRHTIRYLWAISEEDWESSRSYAETMAREARCIMVLG